MKCTFSLQEYSCQGRGEYSPLSDITEIVRLQPALYTGITIVIFQVSKRYDNCHILRLALHIILHVCAADP